jgi:hypothetical protein
MKEERVFMPGGVLCFDVLEADDACGIGGGGSRNGVLGIVGASFVCGFDIVLGGD